MPSIAEKRILITGATSGIGRATAEACAREGARLILTGRRRARLEDLQPHLEAAGSPEVQSLVFDVRSYEEVKQAMEPLSTHEAVPDVLINNAGLALGLAPLDQGSTEDWETMIDTNVKGLLYVSKFIGGAMAQRGDGQIVNVGSIAGKEAYPQGNVYVATKHAVDGLTRAMRMDFVDRGVRVGQIAPGHVETEFALNRFHGDREQAARVYEGFQPLRPEDVAEAILFMITRPASVNVNDMVLMARQQASATFIHREGPA
jgi:NADP-dependent 3-hydroxy acid dehydrogenase YdfG